MALFEIPKHIKRILNDPAHGYLRTHPRASAGLQWILDGTERLPDHEADCDSYTDWLYECGPVHALRPPSAIKGARAVGVEDYFSALGLSGRRLFDVVGIAFDGRSLQRRLWPLLRDWDAGRMTRAPPCPPLADIVRLYRSLDGVVRQHAPLAPRVTNPFPSDLMVHWLPRVQASSSFSSAGPAGPPEHSGHAPAAPPAAARPPPTTAILSGEEALP